MPKQPLAALRILSLTCIASALLGTELVCAAQPASACGTAGSTQGGYTYSSQLSANQLVVCNATAGAAPTNSVNQSSSSTASKVAVTTCATTTSRIYLGAPTYASKLVKTTTCSTGWISMTSVSPPSPKPPATNSTSTSSNQPSSTTGSTNPGTAAQADQQAFSPDSVSILASKQSPAISTDVSLTTTASTHFKTSSILGQSVTVQFVPVQIAWHFGDGQGVEGSMGEVRQIWHAYSTAGAKSVAATVSFVASYRFVGQSVWTTQPGLLTMDATLALDVTQTQPPAAGLRVRLVQRDCLSNPVARGCH